MAVSWGTQWGYVASTNPRKCAAFCEDKRPTAHYAVDEKGNEVVGIRPLPAPTKTTQVVLVDSEREAHYLAKLAQYEALILAVPVYESIEATLRLTIEKNTFKLRMDKSLTEEQAIDLEATLSAQREQQVACNATLSELQELKRRRSPLRELDDILAEADDAFVEVVDG